MKWSTTIAIDKQKGFLQYSNPILLIGSCFAENVGEYLTRAKFDIEVNPFGTLYNPESITMGIERLMSNHPFSKDELANDGNLWYSYHHHGKFSQPTAQATLDVINSQYEQASKMLSRCQRLIITFGTAYVYRLKSNGMTVANCHKQPASLFTRERLTVEDIVQRWSQIITRLQAYAPDCKILFTVSPIRHLRDGAHDNQLSKSTLLLAIDRLCATYSDMCSYFPAYEIVMDELRDYRFYAEDMTHPSAQAIAYICSRMVETYFTEETQQLAERCEKIYRSLQHRPLNGCDNKAYRQFAEKLIAQMLDIEREYPYISYATECNKLKQLITL